MILFTYKCPRQRCADFDFQHKIHATEQEARALRGTTKECASCGTRVRLHDEGTEVVFTTQVTVAKKQRHIFTYVCTKEGCLEHLKAYTMVVLPDRVEQQLSRPERCGTCQNPWFLRNVVPLDPSSAVAQQLDRFGVPS